jgi:fatty-acyl-CoA synthase
MIGLESPKRLVALGFAFERFGLIGGAIASGAIRHGDRTALIDDRGALSYSQLNERTNSLANRWRAEGLKPGEGVAILARNHRGFLEAVFAAAKCGAKIVLLNTSFGGPQIQDVVRREGTHLLAYDDEFSGLISALEMPRGKWRTWAQQPDEDTLEVLIARASPEPPPKPGRAPRIVILTSGTTGAPKGAPRDEPRSLALFGGFLSKVPLRGGQVTELCLPIFHALGLAHAILAIALGSTLVLRRHFDPAETLASLERNQASALVVVPVMLQRILDVVDERRSKPREHLHDLRVLFVGGSQLGAGLCKRGMVSFGPIIYNMYGSTEVAIATIATPADLIAEPGCVGHVVRGSIVEVLDEDDEEVTPGTTGRIFVANAIQFEGYTGGGGKERVRGLMASGDVGHFDAEGRLFIDGRDDEMIVSGGENVFPGEVEELLASHPSIAEVAVIGVDDEQFGQRLKAFVVTRSGAELSDAEVKNYVSEHLARFKAPREVVFLDELPRGPTGKVIKRLLDDRGQ